MDDNQLTNRMNALEWRESDYDENNQEDRLSAFKQAISEDRGSTVTCIEPSGQTVSLDNMELLDLGESWSETTLIGPDSDGQRMWEGCNDGNKFGPKNIITEEYEEWSANYIRTNPINTDPDLQGSSGSTIDESITFGDASTNVMGMELMSPNRGFEDCVNELLNDYDDGNDTQVINEIHEIQNITHLKPEHIQFIKRKLEMMMISSSRGSIKECMIKHIFKDKYSCSTDLAQQMLIILNVLFSTIGFNLHLDDLDNNDVETRKHLIHIIDELGDLIPRALDKIIDISERIEVEKCQKITGKTLLLKEMNEKLFNPQKKSVTLDFGLPNVSDLIDEEKINDTEFQRISILGAIGLAILKFI